MGNEPETIDVLELMKDLDEDEQLAHPKQTSSTDFLATSPKHPSGSFTLEPSNVNEVPQWLLSFQMREVLGRSETSPVAGPSRDTLVYGKARSKYGSISGSTTHTADLSGRKLMVSTQETLAEHLQKSLSFETSPMKEMKRIFGQKDAYHSKGLTLGFDKDTSSFSSSRLPWEGESLSSPSTPYSGGSVSLHKWFHEDAARSKQRQEHKHLEAESKLHVHDASPPLVPKVLVSSSKVTEGAYDHVHSYGRGLDANLGAHRSYDQNQQLGKLQMPSFGLNYAKQEQEQGRIARLRHSLTLGNRRKELSEAKPPPANNRSSSLEIEKVKQGLRVSIVLYSTTSKDDTHAFNDSNAARAILTSIVGATFEERRVSEHPEYEQELKRVLNTQVAVVPTVCARGRYITGLDNIMQVYKKGQLRSLLAQELKEASAPCVCRGGKFLICPVCKGKRKLIARKQEREDDDASCRHCSGTGLIKCPNCLHSST